MANLVYNTINGYTKDLYEKYKGEEEAIDFEKVIPIPDDVKHTVASTMNKKAEAAAKFREFAKFVREKEGDFAKYHFASLNDNPILENVIAYSSNTCKNIGKRCIENPDKSLNQLKEEDSYIAYNYEKLKAIFGDEISKAPDYEQISENYVKELEKDFSEFKSHYPESFYPNESIYDYGNRLMDIKEKYGVSDLYQYKMKYYGVKQNATESAYDPETEQLVFATPWDIPYPVIAKIANDNPRANLKGYSEEQTGWNREYVTKDGKLAVIAKGQIRPKYPPCPTVEPTFMNERFAIGNPIYKTYDQIMEENISEINSEMKPFGSTIM